jgi:Skp family chaperone for outer membrane proteins
MIWRQAVAAVGLLALAIGLHAQPALVAAAPAELRVAVLDVDRVRRSALAVKTIHAQLGTHVDAYRNDTQKEEQEIRAAQEELARKRQVLSPEGYAEERRKLEEQLSSAQARVQQRRQALERVNAEAMQQVQDVLSRIVAEVAGEQQLTLILRKEYVVYISPAPELDITDQVLQRLDREMPSVRIADPGR